MPDKSLKTGLIGADIQGSRSPSIHQAEARALGLDLTYTLFDLDRMDGGIAALPRLLAQVREEGYLGVNITYPVKQAVMALASSSSADAAALGACNTVVLHRGQTECFNTDWIGFAANFQRGLPGAVLDSVVQLGAGGGGAACAYALLKMGTKRIYIHDIQPDRAEQFARRFNALAGADRISVSQDLAGELAAASGLVNCTPIGMSKMQGMPLPGSLLGAHLWVADIVYVPLETELLRQAKAAGCRTLNGGGMAVFQAAEAFRLFTGAAPATERMLARFERDIAGAS